MVKKLDSRTTAMQPLLRRTMAVAALLSSSLFSGCTALTHPIKGVPANRLPAQFFAEEKNELVPIDVSLLAQEEPRQYILGPGDILGVTVDRILPYAEPDQVPDLPPVHFPEANSTLPPSTGFPITVLEDGTISLPLINPIKVEGLTTDQARDKIREAYIESKILKEDSERKVSPVVTVIKERQVNVIVIRQDQSGGGASRVQAQQVSQSGRGVAASDFSASGLTLQLDAYKNDILNALMETGGLPGVTAKNEIKVLRSSQADKEARLEFIRKYGEFLANNYDPCGCPPPMPDDPTILRIPLRLPPGVLPTINPEDVILEEGDIIMIETRETEFFYTGGRLPGGQWPIPRDYDLNALGAMAMTGYSVQQTGNSRGGIGGIGGAVEVVPPGRLYVIRKTPCNGQIAIAVDLTKAINDPRHRPIIQPGDMLILQFKPCEELVNFSTALFFTYGLRYLFQNNN
jgi:protein involved in polysaccharide export with SLBB domain